MALNLMKTSANLSRLLTRRTLLNVPRQFRPVSSGIPALNKKEVSVVFVQPNGEKIRVVGKVGESILDVVCNHKLEFNGFGACEGTLTCSTCHLILKQEDFDSLPDKPVGEECDMLDMAFGVTDTSRLGCQIILTEKMDGIELQVPECVNDVR